MNKYIDLKTNEIVLEIYDSIDDVSDSCKLLIENQDIFLGENYIRALENALPKGMQIKLLSFKKDHNTIGFAMIQMVRVALKKALKRNNATTSINCPITEFLKKHLSSIININVLVGGNLFLTGEHSFIFHSDYNQKDQIHIWNEGIQAFSKEYKSTFKTDLFLLKDFEEHKPYSTFLRESKANDFKVQPHMQLQLQPSWKSIACYTAGFKKKYRKNYTNARNKIKSLELKEFSLNEIQKYKSEIYTLYKNVSDKAEFNTFILNENYFYSLKKHMNSSFRLYAYFNSENTLVGFFTLILNGKNLEPHFLGYDTKYNRTCKLYLNMLFDMVNFAINNEFKCIDFGRTALEIKSSVGAVPVDMNAYLRHNKRGLNKLSGLLLKFLKPKLDWQQRHPFK